MTFGGVIGRRCGGASPSESVLVEDFHQVAFAFLFRAQGRHVPPELVRGAQRLVAGSCGEQQARYPPVVVVARLDLQRSDRGPVYRQGSGRVAINGGVRQAQPLPFAGGIPGGGPGGVQVAVVDERVDKDGAGPGPGRLARPCTLVLAEESERGFPLRGPYSRSRCRLPQRLVARQRALGLEAVATQVEHIGLPPRGRVPASQVVGELLIRMRCLAQATFGPEERLVPTASAVQFGG